MRSPVLRMYSLAKIALATTDRRPVLLLSFFVRHLFQTRMFFLQEVFGKAIMSESGPRGAGKRVPLSFKCVAYNWEVSTSKRGWSLPIYAHPVSERCLKNDRFPTGYSWRVFGWFDSPDFQQADSSLQIAPRSSHNTRPLACLCAWIQP